MVKINYNTEIEVTNFEEMRLHYRDYLRSKSYSAPAIEGFLSDFDVARWEEDYEWIYSKMKEIGVILIGE